MRGTGRILYVDATAGAAGDMLLGAFVDLGVPLAALRDAVSRLPIEGWTLSSRARTVHGIRARKVRVGLRRGSTDDGRTARTWPEIRRIVRAGKLARGIETRSLAAFRALFEAEAEVHGASPDRVHLHEAGAVDAIVDIVGCAAAVDHLAPDRVVVSRLTTGHGSVLCAHGRYPVPAPATQRLVLGVPTTSGDAEGERLTPTGAAILTRIADAFGPPPAMTPERIGYGAGDRDFDDRPNVVRMILGTGPLAASDGPLPRMEPTEGIVVLECTLDDTSPQTVAWTVERLLESGALDAFSSEVAMKKGRPGRTLTVLARPEALERLASVLFRETTTLGVRVREERRFELDRDTRTVRTRFGAIRVKRGLRDGRIVRASPEYEDCARAARRHGAALLDVQRAAIEAYDASTERSASGSKDRDDREKEPS